MPLPLLRRALAQPAAAGGARRGPRGRGSRGAAGGGRSLDAEVAAARLCAEEEAVHGMMHPGRVLLGGTPVYGGEGQYFPIAVRTVAQAVDPAAVEAEMLRFYDSRVLKIQAEAGDADHAPIDGNLYSYLALRVFGETSGLFQVKDAEKENPFLLSGLALVIVIQIVGPICVLAYAFPRALAMMDLSPELFLLRSEGNLHFLSTFTVTKLSQMLIGTLFIVLFILNGLYVLEEDRQTDKRLVHLCQVFRAASRRDPRIPEPCEGWLFVGALVNCWVLVTTALAMWPCFLIADQGPKEVLFDAFALTFLYNLDDISGDLGFLNDQWDSEMFGEVYGSLVDETPILVHLRAARERAFTADNIYYPGIWLTRLMLIVVPALYLLTSAFIDFREAPPSGEGELAELRAMLQALQLKVASLDAGGGGGGGA